MQHTDRTDPSAQLGAYLMTIIVVSLIAMSALDRWPTTAQAEPYAVMIIATPRLPVMVVATPTAAPALPLEPTAAPPPAPEPVVLIQYVEVPVAVTMPATVAPPEPRGETIVQIDPVVEKGALGGRPNDNDGKGRRPNGPPEAVGP